MCFKIRYSKHSVLPYLVRWLVLVWSIIIAPALERRCSCHDSWLTNPRIIYSELPSTATGSAAAAATTLIWAVYWKFIRGFLIMKPARSWCCCSSCCRCCYRCLDDSNASIIQLYSHWLQRLFAFETAAWRGGRSLVYIGFRYNIQKLRKRIYIHQI